MTAGQAKAMGLFNPPGPNRNFGPQYVLGPDGLPAPLHPVPGMGPGFIPRINGPAALGAPGAPMGGMGGSSSNVARQRRRLYVGNITYDCTPENLKQLFNEKMFGLGVTRDEHGLEPVVDVQCNHDKSYAFVEVRSRRHVLLLAIKLTLTPSLSAPVPNG